MFIGHHLVFVMEVKPKSELVPLIVERLGNRKCIKGDGRQHYRNGLCRKCHYKHEQTLNNLPPADRPKAVNRRIRAGEWLTATLGRLLRTEAAEKAARTV